MFLNTSLQESIFNHYPTYMRNIFAVRHTTQYLRGTHMLALSKPRTIKKW